MMTYSRLCNLCRVTACNIYRVTQSHREEESARYIFVLLQGSLALCLPQVQCTCLETLASSLMEL